MAEQNLGRVKGDQGNQGSIGNQGVTGSQGVQGVQGNQGNIGNQGTQGVQGVAGPTGPQGFQGNIGNQGSQGNQGTQGQTGDPYSPFAVGSSSSTAYTLVYADRQNYKVMNNSSAITVTIPTNASVAFEVGTHILFEQAGTGRITISPASGVTLNYYGGLVSLGQYAVIEIVKKATDTWTVIGGGS